MKTGVSLYSFQRLMDRGMDYFAACDKAADMGYECVEFIDLDLKHGRGEGSVAELATNLRRHCGEKGLAIVAYTVAADFLQGRGCAPAEEPERVMRQADVAALLGARLMRHDAFWGLAGLRDYRAAIDRVAPAIRAVSAYAAGLGVRTCTENHGYIMQDSERVERLILTVGSENFGWLVDMGNFLCVDESPAHAVGVAAPYAFHVHAKDFLFKSGECPPPSAGWLATRGANYLRGTVVGHGVVPVAQCLRILDKAGYQGCVSVEFEGMEEVCPALESARAFLREAFPAR